jgi:tetratricopeptide (TPR) repeat protein
MWISPYASHVRVALSRVRRAERGSSTIKGLNLARYRAGRRKWTGEWRPSMNDFDPAAIRGQAEDAHAQALRDHHEIPFRRGETGTTQTKFDGSPLHLGMPAETGQGAQTRMAARSAGGGLLVAVVGLWSSCSATHVNSVSRGSSGESLERAPHQGQEQPRARAFRPDCEGGSSSAGRDADELLEQARALQATGRNEELSELLEDAMLLHPDRGDLYELRGDSAVALGFRRAAECDYESALLLCPKRAELWKKLGEVRLALQQPVGARRALLRALELEPKNPEGMRLLMLSYGVIGAGLPVTRAEAMARAARMQRAGSGPRLAARATTP